MIVTIAMIWAGAIILIAGAFGMNMRREWTVAMDTSSGLVALSWHSTRAKAEFALIEWKHEYKRTPLVVARADVVRNR